MDGAKQFQHLLERSDQARPERREAVSDAAFDGAACPPQRRPGRTLIDAAVGLSIRLALAAVLWRWAQGNAQLAHDWTDPLAWVRPEPGFVRAVSIWLPGFADPGFISFAILAVTAGVAIALAAGFLSRIAGLITVMGAVFYALFILPEAWTSALIMGALGLYLLLRGAGPVSLDFATVRLSRMA